MEEEILKMSTKRPTPTNAYLSFYGVREEPDRIQVDLQVNSNSNSANKPLGITSSSYYSLAKSEPSLNQLKFEPVNIPTFGLQQQQQQQQPITNNALDNRSMSYVDSTLSAYNNNRSIDIEPYYVDRDNNSMYNNIPTPVNFSNRIIDVDNKSDKNNLYSIPPVVETVTNPNTTTKGFNISLNNISFNNVSAIPTNNTTTINNNSNSAINNNKDELLDIFYKSKTHQSNEDLYLDFYGIKDYNADEKIDQDNEESMVGKSLKNGDRDEEETTSDINNIPDRIEPLKLEIESRIGKNMKTYFKNRFLYINILFLNEILLNKTAYYIKGIRFRSIFDQQYCKFKKKINFNICF